MRFLALLLICSFPTLISAQQGYDAVVAGGNLDYFRHSSLSDDGRYVVYQKFLYPLNEVGPNENITNIFLYDRTTNETVWVNQGMDGQPPDQISSRNAVVSGNGKFVAFSSFATNLVEKKTIIRQDVFLYDIEKQELSCITCDIPEYDNITDNYCCPDLSFDGSSLIYSSREGVVHLNRSTSKSKLVATPPPDRMDGVKFDRYVLRNAQISGNGQYITFVTQAPELPLNKQGMEQQACYRTKINTDETIRISGAGINKPRFDNCLDPRISFDGSIISYIDRAEGYDTRFVYNVNSQMSHWASRKYNGKKVSFRGDSFPIRMSNDGRFLSVESVMIFLGNPNKYKKSLFEFPTQGWIYDTFTAKHTLVHSNTAGKATQVEVRVPSISGDGKWIAFIAEGKDANTPLSHDPNSDPYYHLLLKRNTVSITDDVALTKPKATSKNKSIRVRLKNLENALSFVVELFKGSTLLQTAVVDTPRAKFKKLKPGAYKIRYRVGDWAIEPSNANVTSKFRKVRISKKQRRR